MLNIVSSAAEDANFHAQMVALQAILWNLLILSDQSVNILKFWHTLV